MRRISLAVLIGAGIGVGSLVFGGFFAYSQTQTKTKRHAIYYVDPMHPSYKSDKPGIAPDCGMQLVPVYEGDAASAAAAPKPVSTEMEGVAIDGNAQKISGIRVEEVRKGSASRMAQVVGRVTPEDVRVYVVNPGVDGFVRETFNDSVGTLVKKDQKIASYYSPDFLSAASGFLAASERVPGTVGKDGAKFTPNWGGTIAKEGVRSIQGYTDHLRNLGMSDAQIAHMAETRELPDSIEVVAPEDGFILARYITPGMHFDHNMMFYKIANLSKVWVVAEINESDAQSLRPGSMAQVTLRDGARRMSARVTDSLPQSEAGGGTVKVRLELDNPSFVLRPDMVVDVNLPLGTMAGVELPMDALVYSGDRTRVYVERGQGMFEPRDVETGSRMGDQVEILRGVQPGDRIVVAGTFLVDSENRLKNPVAAAAPKSLPMAASTDAPSTTAAPMADPAPAPAPEKAAEMHDHDHIGSMKMSHDQHSM